MLKTIKTAFLLSLFAYSFVFPMRQIAQVALARTLNQSASFRNSLAARCLFNPMTEMFCMSEEATNVDVKFMVANESVPSLQPSPSAMADMSDLCQESSHNHCLADVYLAMDHQDAATDNQALAGLKQGEEVENTQWCVNRPPELVATNLQRLPPVSGRVEMDHQDMIKINQAPADLSQSGASKNAHLHLDRHPKPIAPNRQFPSSIEMVHERASGNTREGRQCWSGIFSRAESEQNEQELFRNAKSQVSCVIANFAPTVQDKVCEVMNCCASLSYREILAYRAALANLLRALENEFLSFTQQNAHIRFTRDATQWGLDSASIPYHAQDKLTLRDQHEMVTALTLKADIEAIKVVIQGCDGIISRFEQEKQDFVRKVEDASIDGIEKEIVPDREAKKEAVNVLAVQKEDELNYQNQKLEAMNAQLESFSKRSAWAKIGSVAKGIFKPDHSQDRLVVDRDAVKVEQEKTSRELQSLYDKEKEYNAQIEYAQKIANEKKQVALQEALLLQEKQKQEALIFHEQLIKSYHDSCSFDIADCPERALEQQWHERQQALSATQEQGYTQYDQSFNLTSQAAGYLAAQGIDYKDFQSLYGTALQQHLHGEICSIIEKAAGLQRDLPYQSNFLQSSVLLADAAHEANKLDQVRMVVALNNLSFQFLDTVDSYSLAAVHGVMHGLQNCAHTIAHPIETIVALPHTVESLAKGLYYVFETAALTECAEEFGFEDLYVDLRDQRNAEIAAGLKILGEKIAESTGPEIVEALAQFGTDFYVSGKVMHAVGGILGVVRSQVKVAQATEAVAAIAGEQAGVGEAAGDLAKTMQKMEQVAQEKIALQVADKLRQAEQSSVKIRQQYIKHSKQRPKLVDTISMLDKNLKIAENASAEALNKRQLPDGRVRYYEAETASSTPGPTRGSAYVTEYDPNRGIVRSWYESYDHTGRVNRVHPKMINGKNIDSLHYPHTGKELAQISLKAKDKK